MFRKKLSEIGLAVIGAAGLCMAASQPASAAAFGAQTALQSARFNSASCVIPNTGSIIVAGGETGVGAPTSAVDVYSSTFVQGAGLSINNGGTNAPRAEARMIPVAGTDRCLLLGGRSAAAGTANTAMTEIFQYDESDDAWTKVGDLGIARFNFEVVKISNTKFLVMGGQSLSNTYLDSIEVIDITVANPVTLAVARLTDNGAPATNINLSEPKANFQAVPIVGTSPFEVYVIGGENTNDARGSVDRVTIDGLNGGTVAAMESLTNDGGPVRKNFVAFPISKTISSVPYDILITGGKDAAGNVLGSTYLYDIGTNDWQAETSLNLQNVSEDLKACTNSAGDTLVVGGVNGANTVASAQKWIDANDAWVDADANSVADVDTMLTSRFLFALECAGTKAFVAGGVRKVSGNPDVILSSTELSP